MEQSILNSVKKNVGLDPTNTEFDHDIITFINGTCSTLTQLGIGPVNGFMIEDETAVWDDLIGDDLQLLLVKSYMYLCVRMLFDPPELSFVIDMMNKQKLEMEWRLNVHREDLEWVSPDPEIENDTILLGGGA